MGRLITRRGFFAQAVDAPVKVCVSGAIELVHGLDDRMRFLRGGGIVQIDKGRASIRFASLTTSIFQEDWKVRPNFSALYLIQ